MLATIQIYPMQDASYTDNYLGLTICASMKTVYRHAYERRSVNDSAIISGGRQINTIEELFATVIMALPT